MVVTRRAVPVLKALKGSPAGFVDRRDPWLLTNLFDKAGQISSLSGKRLMLHYP
ncbi:hypothetical protein [Erwinia sp.]|uniref:hypothetical protein n=1 Tax=Erwinia citreus TaxID=558 RepID=UPI0028996A4A|nr:hypothetical protein [Erwinia sp.]